MTSTAVATRIDRVASQLDELFRAEGLPTHGQQIARAVEASASRLARPLTDAEAAFLDAHSGIPAADRDPDAALLSAALDAPAEGPVLTVATVALRLGVDRSTVSRRTDAGKLFSLKASGRHVYPAWQFGPQGVLLGLADALARVPAGWGVHRLGRFMTTPDEVLDGLPPTQWLASGGDPDAVAQLLVDSAAE